MASAMCGFGGWRRHGEATARDPARPGEILAVYMTGLGPVSPPVLANRPAPADRFSRTRLPVACQWNVAEGGPMAEVLFAGLAPGQMGIYQVNLSVAQDARSGELTCSPATFAANREPGGSAMVPVSRP